MSSGHLRNFQNNFWIFCKFWILLNIDRTWNIAGCCEAYFRLCLFVFDKFDCHLKNLSLKLKLTNGRPTLGWPCTLSPRATIMNLMGVGLMADWNFADLDCQRYFLFLSSHFALSQSLFVLLQTGVSVPCLRTVFVPCCELFLSYFYYTLFIGVVKWVTLIYFVFLLTRWLADPTEGPILLAVKIRQASRWQAITICTKHCVLF